MHFRILWHIVFVLFNALSSVHGALFVVKPLKSTICYGGSACTVQWVDNGVAPLLTNIGACTVALYTGIQQIVQQLNPVDVSATHSFVFTPNPDVGPDADTYYIGFTSTSLENGTNQFFFQGFSPAFTLENMRGSFASPILSATSSIPVPSTVASPQPNTVLTTTTIGVSSTPSPTPFWSSSSSSLSLTPAQTRTPSTSSSPIPATTLILPQSFTTISTPIPSLPAPSNVSTAVSLAIPVCSIPRASVIISLLVLSSLATFS